MKHICFCETAGKDIEFRGEVPIVVHDLMKERSTGRIGVPEFDCYNKWDCPAKIITINHDGTLTEHWDRCIVRPKYLKAPHKFLGRATQD